MSNEDKAREAREAREFAARLELRADAADAAGDHDKARRLHNNARGHRADARAMEAQA